ncbi:hypothetical protein MASR2M15_24200 [Anaerolineales bacterium]
MLDILLKPDDVSCEMLRAEFWADLNPTADETFIKEAEIKLFNESVYTIIDIPPIETVGTVLEADFISEKIQAYKLGEAEIFFADGKPIDVAYRQALETRRTLDLKGKQHLRYALAKQRCPLYRFPCGDYLTAEPFEIRESLLIESHMDIGWPAVIAAQTEDREWSFILTHHYWAWVESKYLLILDRETVLSYGEASPAIVAMASRCLIGSRTGGENLIQLGSRLPVQAESAEYWQVRLPGDKGLVDGYISKRNTNYSAFEEAFPAATMRQVFKTAFRLLGERYAWGGTRGGIFGRDCSRFVRDIYATMGIYLPRNSSQQGKVGHMRFRIEPEMDLEARNQMVIEQSRPGDLLFSKGHVMLYLGAYQGKAYVIHATGGQFMSVIVSTLLPDASQAERAPIHHLTHGIGVMA